MPAGFYVVKDGVARIDGARRIQKGTDNGAATKRRARKPAARPDKRRREHDRETWAGKEKAAACDILCICDSKHSHLRQAFLVPRPYRIWQDSVWGDRESCDKAPSN